MGGISFYRSKDGYLMRQKSSVSGDRIKNDPAFSRTRENLAEFGRAVSSGKILKTALRPLIMNVADGRMTNRLAQQMMKVIQADTTNVRGQRNVIDGDPELLTGFEFNENGRLDKTLLVPYSWTIDRPTGVLTITIPEFIAANLIAVPPGSTHFKLVAGGAAIDFKQGTYTSGYTDNGEHMFDTTPTAAQVLTINLSPATHPLFLAFGIVFSQEVNGAYYPLRNGAFNALALVGVDGADS
jgi:hypothetical protein